MVRKLANNHWQGLTTTAEKPKNHREQIPLKIKKLYKSLNFRRVFNSILLLATKP